MNKHGRLEFHIANGIQTLQLFCIFFSFRKMKKSAKIFVKFNSALICSRQGSGTVAVNEDLIEFENTLYAEQENIMLVLMP